MHLYLLLVRKAKQFSVEPIITLPSLLYIRVRKDTPWVFGFSSIEYAVEINNSSSNENFVVVQKHCKTC